MIHATSHADQFVCFQLRCAAITLCSVDDLKQWHEASKWILEFFFVVYGTHEENVQVLYVGLKLQARPTQKPISEIVYLTITFPKNKLNMVRRLV